jgi:hypothetical protein
MAAEASLQLTHDPVHQRAMTRTAGPALAPRLCASTLCYASTRRHQLARHAHHSLRAHSRTSRACAVPSARVCSCASARLSRISALGCAARSHHCCSARQRSPPWVTTGPPAAWATAACRSRAHTCGRTEPRLLGLRLLAPRAPACPRAAPGPAARPPVLPLAPPARRQHLPSRRQPARPPARVRRSLCACCAHTPLAWAAAARAPPLCAAACARCPSAGRRCLCRGGEREGGAGGVKDWGQSKVSPVGEKRKGKTELDRTAAGGKRDKAPEEELRGSDAWNSCSRMWQGWSAQRRLQSRN